MCGRLVIAGITMLVVDVVHHFLLLVITAANEEIPIESLEGELYTELVTDVLITDL
jgi:hypothetical protein